MSQGQEIQDRREIRELIENWVLWRDAGLWERFRTVWHDDGRMMATWTQGTADEFIAMSKAEIRRADGSTHSPLPSETHASPRASGTRAMLAMNSVRRRGYRSAT